MKSSSNLKSLLKNIDRKGYPAYKNTQGTYDFGTYFLSIDHVQGDPFASPSKLSIHVKGRSAGFPASFYDTKYKQVALCDHLTRLFYQTLSKISFRAKGSGKSGLFSVSKCGQQVLERTACTINPSNGDISVHFEAGFPANGRTVNARELDKMLFGLLPDCVSSSLFYKNIEGIPVAWAGAKSNNVNYSNPCYVRVVVGRDDIKLIADNYTYNITCGGSPENNQLCTLEDAITAFNTDNQYAGGIMKMKITEIRQVYCPLAKVMDDYYRGTEAVTYPVWQITYEVESATVKDGTAYRGVTKSIYIMNTTYNIIRKMSSQS